MISVHKLLVLLLRQNKDHIILRKGFCWLTLLGDTVHHGGESRAPHEAAGCAVSAIREQREMNAGAELFSPLPFIQSVSPAYRMVLSMFSVGQVFLYLA